MDFLQYKFASSPKTMYPAVLRAHFCFNHERSLHKINLIIIYCVYVLQRMPVKKDMSRPQIRLLLQRKRLHVLTILGKHMLYVLLSGITLIMGTCIYNKMYCNNLTHNLQNSRFILHRDASMMILSVHSRYFIKIIPIFQKIVLS